MELRKAGGKIYGVTLTAAEKKGLNIEIQRALQEKDREHLMEIDALFLWELHRQLGFGPKRLKRFYDSFAPALRDVIDHYDLENPADQLWYCDHKLKEIGIDIRAWDAERSE